MEEKNQNELITELLNRGPMAAMYFTVAIDVLKQVLDQETDQFIWELFGWLIPPDTIRNCTNQIHQTLHPQENENTNTTED